MVDKKIFLKGSPLCSGVAIGKPFIFTFADEIIPNFSIAANEVEDEIKRYRKALRLSKKDITKLQKKLKKEGASEGADMLATHLHILQDPLITTAVEDKIRETRKNTEYIFRLVVDEYEERFNKISDEFFRERFRDIQDISRRILAHLRKSVTMSLAEIPENSVVFAHSLLPSDVAEAKISSVAAFVTEGCGETSHAVIVAKAKGIPYVSTRDFDVIEEKIQSGKKQPKGAYSKTRCLSWHTAVAFTRRMTASPRSKPRAVREETPWQNRPQPHPGSARNHGTPVTPAHGRP